MFLTPMRLLTVGTDGHAVLWPLLPEVNQPSEGSRGTWAWECPTKLHQNSSKAMTAQRLSEHLVLIVSGGDDGSLALLLTSTQDGSTSAAVSAAYVTPPTIVSCAHASAVTACALITLRSRLFLVTSGNDEWTRLWEITVQGEDNVSVDGHDALQGPDRVAIQRLAKVKTNVADVSSMTALEVGEDFEGARILICGVGMEVVRINWDAIQLLVAKR